MLLIRHLYSSAYNTAAPNAAYAATANTTMLIMRDLEKLLIKYYYCC